MLALAASLFLVPIVLASNQICGQWDTLTGGDFTLYQDLWGESAATSGSQCSWLNSTSGDCITWGTQWTWQGGQYNVKSFANVGLTMTPKQLSGIKSIPTTWDYTYTGTSGAVADVAYDMFLSSTSGGTAQYEVMVWLDALGGAGPISSSGSPIATPTIGSHSWKLYSGPNGQMTVYSFVASSTITAFSGDLIEFFEFLESNEGVSSSQYLNSIQAGTEPFVGTNAKLQVSNYCVALD
ncbi:concanavalin A-like lectin/glucanase [Gloeophyllum trabeum ATCC 11539]|uniref:Concanavalin A-like lectin/glucanase n=1 Tax=Gloeophyllum trabeum (strain ATCC 11539 / FP-39264 / Madison 617) TaxID=670483 RepID=S7RMJ3_GLOTA|nr:concanavalin A-like lectin/glucanase [Gloeophyllum trabeum ATCC 11539]EPQ53909.1 concanavalin A-like lectin/glucanase [Gloeophyllum trabeum ATCC 11539]